LLPVSNRLLVTLVAISMMLVPATAGLASSSTTTPPASTNDAAVEPYDGLPTAVDRFTGTAGAELSFEETIELGKLVGHHQASTLGDGLAIDLPTPNHDSPSEAVLTLTEMHDSELTDEQLDEIQQLDELDEPVRGALTDVVDAFLSFHLAAEAAYGPGGLPGHGDIFSARNSLLDAVAAFHDVSQGDEGNQGPDEVHVAPFFSWDRAATDTTYTEDIVLLLDEGGDDKYRNNAGGTDTGFTPAAALFDFGDGEDAYGDPEVRQYGVNGGGHGGAGVLVEAGGDDNFTANAGATENGGATNGSGFLLDAGGNETYGDGTSNRGVNGGGRQAGSGTLVDIRGNDDYMASSYGANGGGHEAGSGLLVDLQGNDTYSADWPGANGGAGFIYVPTPAVSVPVSHGLLFDGAGNDRYDSWRDRASGTDVTMIPKGIVGAQIDLDGPPSGG
jgi:hypothetical protein